jgi:hypothetical protein
MSDGSERTTAMGEAAVIYGEFDGALARVVVDDTGEVVYIRAGMRLCRGGRFSGTLSLFDAKPRYRIVPYEPGVMPYCMLTLSELAYGVKEGTWKEESQRSEPDIAPFQSLAMAVAEVCSTPTREASRRYIDMAIGAIRGERYAGAIKSVLVAMSDDRAEYGLRPKEIAVVIDACRAWESSRAALPFNNRRLTPDEVKFLKESAQLACFGRLSGFHGAVVANVVADVYERARALC